ncbi:unnamed protein product [Sphagnum troendelagicum]|uniref:Peptidase C45 hydrolase domain-containing protein n=1 Tax=Sphagnum troendelagicum TaxID=128251 RepID=A0ABP0TR65_9BRYO
MLVVSGFCTFFAQMGSEEFKPWLPCLRLRSRRGYELGFAIGQHFGTMIHSRFKQDPYLHSQMLPFAMSAGGQQLISSLSATNKTRFPEYWDEMCGTADGSQVPFLQVLLINMRKEIAPFLPTKTSSEKLGDADQCSTVLLHSDNLSLIAHNEDAHVSILNHVYLVHAELEDGLSFVAYTYAGELPSCAFGFNSYGVVFTLNSVPLASEEAVAGGVARNFISRDLLEAHNLDDALERARERHLSVGHNYNIMDINERKIVTVETASNARSSTRNIAMEPFFHANMYLHLQVPQVANETSLYRQKRAEQLPKLSKMEILSLLGNATDEPYPIYMQGPTLITLCTVLFDLQNETWTVYRGNPQEQVIHSHDSLRLHSI